MIFAENRYPLFGIMLQSPPERLAGLVPRLLAGDPDILQQMIVELAQVLPLVPSRVHAPERSE